LDGVLNYAYFFWIRDTLFNQKDMYNIRNYYSEWGKNIDMNRLNYMANFCDNQITPERSAGAAIGRTRRSTTGPATPWR
jgi:hypothetical protein